MMDEEVISVTLPDALERRWVRWVLILVGGALVTALLYISINGVMLSAMIDRHMRTCEKAIGAEEKCVMAFIAVPREDHDKPR